MKEAETLSQVLVLDISSSGNVWRQLQKKNWLSSRTVSGSAPGAITLNVSVTIALLGL